MVNIRYLLLPERVRGKREYIKVGLRITGGDSKKVKRAQEIQAEVANIER